MDNEERVSIYQNVIHEPCDDAARLVYADWLDDHGQCVWAGFIRSQIRLSNELGGGFFDYENELLEDAHSQRFRRVLDESAREWEKILNTNYLYNHWPYPKSVYQVDLDTISPPGHAFIGRVVGDALMAWPFHSRLANRTVYGPTLVLERGFFSRVICSFDEFAHNVGKAEIDIERTPISDVTITYVEPDFSQTLHFSGAKAEDGDNSLEVMTFSNRFNYITLDSIVKVGDHPEEIVRVIFPICERFRDHVAVSDYISSEYWASLSTYLCSIYPKIRFSLFTTCQDCVRISTSLCLRLSGLVAHEIGVRDRNG